VVVVMDDLKEKIAREIMEQLDRHWGQAVGPNVERIRERIEQTLRERAADLKDNFVSAEMRTCVSPDSTVKVQLRGDGRSLFLLGLPLRREPDDTDEQMCDDWSDWEEV